MRAEMDSTRLAFVTAVWTQLVGVKEGCGLLRWYPANLPKCCGGSGQAAALGWHANIPLLL